MSLALHYWIAYAHHCSGPPVSEMTCTVSSGTLNSSIPYHTFQAESSGWLFKLPLAGGGGILWRYQYSLFNVIVWTGFDRSYWHSFPPQEAPRGNSSIAVKCVFFLHFFHTPAVIPQHLFSYLRDSHGRGITSSPFRCSSLDLMLQYWKGWHWLIGVSTSSTRLYIMTW